MFGKLFLAFFRKWEPVIAIGKDYNILTEVKFCLHKINSEVHLLLKIYYAG